MSAQLVIIAGPDRGMVIPLSAGKPLQIGRGPQPDVALKDLYVSRLHCRVELQGDGVLVTDLGSAAGTFVNNQPITSKIIRDGAFLQIGETHLSVRLSGPRLRDQATIAPPMAVAIEPVDRLAPTQLQRPPDAVPARAVGSTPSKPPPSKRKKAPALPSERLTELSGEILADYEVGPLVGRGKSGLVFRALDLKKSKTVALKVLWPESTRDNAEIRRFVRSMKTALPLRHPNLVSVYGAGKKRGYCYIAMKFIEGESLTEMMRRLGIGGRVDWRVVFPLGVQLARALDFAHRRKIIHRNLTLQNVLIRRSDQRAFLSDLFLAKAMEGGLAAQLTRPGEVLGDVRFMSPERLEGIRHIDHRADLYSLGALLYTLMAGRPPFEGDTLLDVIAKVRTQEPEDAKKFQLAIPGSFNDVVRRLLAKRPEDRYQETPQLLEELERLGRFIGQ